MTYNQQHNFPFLITLDLTCIFLLHDQTSTMSSGTSQVTVRSSLMSSGSPSSGKAVPPQTPESLVEQQLQELRREQQRLQAEANRLAEERRRFEVSHIANIPVSSSFCLTKLLRWNLYGFCLLTLEFFVPCYHCNFVKNFNKNVDLLIFSLLKISFKPLLPLLCTCIDLLYIATCKCCAGI